MFNQFRSIFPFMFHSRLQRLRGLLGRDSGNDFQVPEIGSDSSHCLFILFCILMSCLVVFLNNRRFLELTFVSGAD